MASIEKITVPVEKKFLDLDIEKVLGMKVILSRNGIKCVRTDRKKAQPPEHDFVFFNRLRNANGRIVSGDELIDDIWINGLFPNVSGAGGSEGIKNILSSSLMRRVNKKLQETYPGVFLVVHERQRGYKLTRIEK